MSPRTAAHARNLATRPAPSLGIDKTLTLVSFQHNVMFPAGHVSGSQCLRYDPGVQP